YHATRGRPVGAVYTGLAMSPLKLPLEIEDIKAILPHRHPFLLVDRILEFEEDKRILGVKNVSSDERYFIAGPGGRPVLPASILTEAMAQAGAGLILSKPENRSPLIYFMGVDRGRFRRPGSAGGPGVVPGGGGGGPPRPGEPARRRPRGRARGVRGADDVLARRPSGLSRRPCRVPRAARPAAARPTRPSATPRGRCPWPAPSPSSASAPARRPRAGSRPAGS